VRRAIHEDCRLAEDRVFPVSDANVRSVRDARSDIAVPYYLLQGERRHHVCPMDEAGREELRAVSPSTGTPLVGS
jgi:hypothetical protein